MRKNPVTGIYKASAPGISVLTHGSREAAAREIARAAHPATASGAALHDIVGDVQAAAGKINAVMRQTATAMQEAAEAAADLAAQTGGLTEFVTEMKKE